MPEGEPAAQDWPQTGVRELLDRQAITEVLHLYCRAIDRTDEELLASVYHPDAIDDHGSFSGDGAAFVARTIRRMREEYEASQHRISNILIELHDDVAFVESYVVAIHSLHDGRIEMAGARYVDRFARREASWKIAHRLVLIDWDLIVASGEASPHLSAFPRGARDTSDPVYDRD
jgi:ketosteroid isomerase-like protein